MAKWAEFLGARRTLVVLLALFFFPGCTHVFYQPDKALHYPPEKFGYKPVLHRFTSRDDTKLVAWFFPSKRAKPLGTVVQFHGNAQNISSHYLSLVWLTEMGFNLFTFDYRGYGLSAGSATPEGVYDDSVAALDLAYQLHESSVKKAGLKKSKFVIVGQSLGGAIAMRAHADFSHRSATNLIVLESTFSSYRSVARKALSSHWLTWAFSPLASLLVSDEYASIEALKNNATRLLVIHDRRDPAVPHSEGLKIFEEATGPKTFWETDYGTHIDFFSPHHAGNREKFIQFLNKAENDKSKQHLG